MPAVPQTEDAPPGLSRMWVLQGQSGYESRINLLKKPNSSQASAFLIYRGELNVTIALDAMGGDHGPGEIVAGAMAALRELGIRSLLVGNRPVLEEELTRLGAINELDIIEADELIGMDESPAGAVRKKKNSSIVVATRLVKEGRANAVVSAGSTGAQMAAALFGLGRIKGIDRPAIATVIPTLKGGKLLLDAGATVDSQPHNLLQWAIMGSIYAEKVMHILQPRVGLLNIGAERTKGNELTIAAYDILEQSGLKFIGNIEGRELYQGQTDVIVCDGFVGNVTLKLSEGLAGALMTMTKEELGRSWLCKVGALLARPGFVRVKKLTDYAEYGGAPLLGVAGVSIICHGSSRAKAIKNGLRVAQECVNNKFIEEIKHKLVGVEEA